MHHVMNLHCSVLYKMYKSELIKSGKDLFPGVSETLAEWLAMLLLLSLPSVTQFLQKCFQDFITTTYPTPYPYTHTANVLSAWLFSPHPDTIIAIHPNINQGNVKNKSVSCWYELQQQMWQLHEHKWKMTGFLSTQQGLTVCYNPCPLLVLTWRTTLWLLDAFFTDRSFLLEKLDQKVTTSVVTISFSSF